MKKLKKGLALVLCAFMLFGSIPITVNAQENENLANLDFSCNSLIVACQADQISDDATIESSFDGVYILNFNSAEETKDAYIYYSSIAEFCDLNVECKINCDDCGDPMHQENDEFIKDSAEDTIEDTVTAEEISVQEQEPQQPMEEVATELDSIKVENTGNINYQGAIALIDTGVDPGDNIINRVSVIGETFDDDNGHGNKMVKTIVSKNPAAKVVSIKALGSDGKGTIADVYKAMEWAIENNVSIINLSLNAYSTEETTCLNQAIEEAHTKGIYVVVSAGNDNRNTKYYTPANNMTAYVIGSAKDEKTKTSFSNFGDSVDFYIVSDSTSEAATLFSGMLSKNLDNVSSFLEMNKYHDFNDNIDKIETNEQDSSNIFATMTDEEINKFIDEKHPAVIGQHLSLLSQDELNQVLNRDTQLNEIITEYKVIDVIDNEQILDNGKEIQFSDYCLEQYDIEKDNVTSNGTFNTKNGYFYFNLSNSVTGKTGKCKIGFTLTSTNASASQTITAITLSNKTGDLQNLSISKMKSEKGTGAANYMVFNFTSKIDLGAYCLLKDAKATDRAPHDNNDGGFYRLNFENYESSSNGTTSLPTTASSNARTVSFNIQCDGRNAGIEVQQSDVASKVQHHATANMSVYCTHNSVYGGAAGIHTKCSVCGATLTTAHDYTVDSGVQYTAATCTANRVNYKRCACGYNPMSASYVVAVANTATGHSWTKASTRVKTAPTCTTTGLNYYDCSKCNSTANTSTTYATSALGHDWTKESARVKTEPTCTSKGANYYDCNRCGDSSNTSVTYETNALGHDYATTFTTDLEPTCTENGSKSKHCNRCDDKTEITIIDKLGHMVPDQFSYKDNNNIENGEKYKNCERCNERLSTAYFVKIEKGKGVDKTTASSYVNKDDDVSINAVLKEGYQFKEWMGDISSDVLSYTFTIPNKAIVIKATAEPIAYSISYDLQGGSIETENAATYNIETNSFTLNNPIKKGYKFTGWTGSNGSAPQKEVTISQGTIGNKSYTANWQIINYDISYDTDGGINNDENPSTYTVLDEVIFQPAEKLGYTFKAWINEVNETTEGISVGSTGNVSIKAKYEIITYNITYDLKGGSVKTQNPTTYNIETETFTLNNPTKKGYTFVGWTDSNNSTPQKTVSINIGSYGDKTYEAVWEAIPYSITYDLKGGTVNTENPVTYNIETETFTLNNPTKTGYKFKGWTGSNGSTPEKNVSVNVGSTGNKTYTANWEIITYDISYNLNEGKVKGNPTTYTIESDTITLNNPKRTGRTFLGWTYEGVTDPQLTVKIEKGSYGNKTFTANFSESKPIESEGSKNGAEWVVFNDGELYVTGEITGPLVDPVTGETPWGNSSDITSITVNCEIKDDFGKELFKGLENVITIEFDEDFDTSQATDLSGMFEGCKNLTDIDLTKIDPSNATTIESIFKGCESLEKIDISSWDISNVEDMTDAFEDCKNAEEIIIGDIDTTNVNSMEGLFAGCLSLKQLDLSGLNTKNVTNMKRMFSDCKNLESIYIAEKWSTKKVTASNDMFKNCKKLYNFDDSNTDKKLAYLGGNGFLEELNHAWADKYTIDKKPTCLDKGSKSKHCTRCNEVKAVSDVEPLGHDFSKELENHKATCTEDGYSIYQCSRCDKTSTIVGDPKTGHSAGKAIVENKVEATVDKEGSYDKVVKCKNCGIELSRENIVIPKLEEENPDEQPEDLDKKPENQDVPEKDNSSVADQQQQEEQKSQNETLITDNSKVEVSRVQSKTVEYIDGYIKDDKDSPIANATVAIDDKSTKTNESGYFKIENVSYGTHTLTVESNGVIVVSASLTVDKNTSTIDQDDVSGEIDGYTINLTIPEKKNHKKIIIPGLAAIAAGGGTVAVKRRRRCREERRKNNNI